jgi:hypothetical protein
MIRRAEVVDVGVRETTIGRTLSTTGGRERTAICLEGVGQGRTVPKRHTGSFRKPAESLGPKVANSDPVSM